MHARAWLCVWLFVFCVAMFWRPARPPRPGAREFRRARASSAERRAARELEALRAAVAERRAELAALG
ncbi:MC116R [Molluscum contagiosum virus subtype 1]|uniref:MC116R n=3 Tax=Molluscum contagiosum virus TaxID=10279 RepID=Q98283_MCV1|nr:MC116R [Molluscum contagiosum virus subtype 1]AZT86350.1 MC116R [Molluscum contagiosum virus]AAC55244.1 MC116R [Molluscum contagiosum virus subtype 1]AQY16865.1 MC116 [Molluscum contagiosum virus subtype 1]AQY17044.1 MC116 [Molluscum contagiosum virus subtype 1]AQY17223.1 MC116 [Molluscum contagiosum virus subtype 1]